MKKLIIISVVVCAGFSAAAQSGAGSAGTPSSVYDVPANKIRPAYGNTNTIPEQNTNAKIPRVKPEESKAVNKGGNSSVFTKEKNTNKPANKQAPAAPPAKGSSSVTE